MIPRWWSDTITNVQDTEEYVVNIVTHEFAAAINQTSASLPASVSEFEYADLNREPSTIVELQRVEGITAAFECTVYEIQRLGRMY